MSNLIKAIRNLKPTSEFSIENDDYATIHWDFIEGNPPTQKEIDDEIVKINDQEILNQNKIATEKAALLDRLGITENEAKLLLG